MMEESLTWRRFCLVTTLISMCLTAFTAQAFTNYENYVEIGNQSFQTTIDLDDVDAFFDLIGVNVSTNALMESAFDEFEGFAADLADLIKVEALKSPDILEVYRSYVPPYITTLTFTQTNNSLTATLDGLGLHMLGKADGSGIFCPTLDFEVLITNLQASLTYNFSTGLLTLSGITYDVESDADCSGLLGFIGNLFSDGILADKITEVIEDSLFQLDAFLDMQELLSTADLTSWVGYYSEQVSASSLPYKTQISTELDRVERFLDRLYVDSGFQLEISIVRYYNYSSRGRLRRVDSTLSIHTNAF